VTSRPTTSIEHIRQHPRRPSWAQLCSEGCSQGTRGHRFGRNSAPRMTTNGWKTLDKQCTPYTSCTILQLTPDHGVRTGPLYTYTSRCCICTSVRRHPFEVWHNAFLASGDPLCMYLWAVSYYGGSGTLIRTRQIHGISHLAHRRFHRGFPPSS